MSQSTLEQLLHTLESTTQGATSIVSQLLEETRSAYPLESDLRSEEAAVVDKASSLAALESRVLVVEKELERVRTSLFLQRTRLLNALTPISVLPDEILCEIFSLSKRHCLLEPLYITHVCSRWRRVALNQRYIWDLPCWHSSKALVDLWLERSQGIPLYIFFDCGEIRNWDDEFLVDLVPSCDRWKSLTFESIADRSTSYAITDDFMVWLSRRDLPLIESMNIYFEHHGQNRTLTVELPLSPSCVPMLQSLDLRKIYIPSLSSIAHQLRMLSIYSVRFTADEFIQLLTCCKHLTTLSLSNITLIGSPHGPVLEPVIIPEVTKLLAVNLRITALGVPIYFPKLRDACFIGKASDIPSLLRSSPNIETFFLRIDNEIDILPTMEAIVRTLDSDVRCLQRLREWTVQSSQYESKDFSLAKTIGQTMRPFIERLQRRSTDRANISGKILQHLCVSHCSEEAQEWLRERVEIFEVIPKLLNHIH